MEARYWRRHRQSRRLAGDVIEDNYIGSHGGTDAPPALRRGRELHVSGMLPPVGNTVNLEDGDFTHNIGASELSAVWRDLDFDSSKPAVYYMRMLEIPTPRWTTHDAIKNGLPLLEGVATTVHEHAWTSPIWYTPEAS